MDPCYYGDDNLDTAVKSLHALTPYLNNSASTEAQHLSGNISAAIFPVVGQLLVCICACNVYYLIVHY